MSVFFFFFRRPLLITTNSRSSQALSGSLFRDPIHRRASSISKDCSSRYRVAMINQLLAKKRVEFRAIKKKEGGGGDSVAFFDDVEEEKKKKRGTALRVLFPHPLPVRTLAGCQIPLFLSAHGHQAELLPLQACPSWHRRPLPRREKTTTKEQELLRRCCCCCCRCCRCRRRQQQQLHQSLMLLAPKRLDFRRHLLLPMTSQRRWRPKASRRREQPAALPAYRGEAKGGKSEEGD